MKKTGGLLIIFALLLGFLPVNIAAAEACANTSTYGAVNLSVPELTETKQQALWVRMQAPLPESRVLVEVNGEDCLEIGGDINSTDWSWQTWKINGSPAFVDFDKSTGNSIKIIGVSDGVKIDRILLTKNFCTPQDYGSNCRDSLDLSQPTVSGDITMLAPPSNEAVAGKVLLSSTPQQHKSRLEKLEYSVDGKIIQTVMSPEPFDTTLVPNGKYQVGITTTLDTGTVFREATVIEIKNSENVFSPLVRWVRLNTRIVSMVGVSLGAALVLVSLFNLLRMAYKHHRERTFHGF